MKKDDTYRILLILSGVLLALVCGILATRNLIKKKDNKKEDNKTEYIDKNNIEELVKHFGE